MTHLSGKDAALARVIHVAGAGVFGLACAWALVRRGARGLRLVGVPVSGFATDILIGAGCVAEVQTSAASLGEASGVLVALPAGWMSYVVSFAETTDGIVRRIDAVVASARRREA